MNKKREMASLTKIMTCFSVCKCIEKYKININREIKMSKTASKCSGTSANLKQGDVLKIIDLLFALMLPSGNDAAV